MVQSKISLTVLGVLGLAMLTAVVWQQSHPHYPHYQPLWQTTEKQSRPLSEHAASVEHSHEGFHEHRSPGKPAADVTLESSGLQALALHEATQVDLELQTHLKGQLRVTLETSPQLQLVNGNLEHSFILETSDTVHLPLNLMATSEGRHYVHLMIEHTDATGVTTARALATEFRVGMPLVEKLFDKNLSMGDPNRLVSLPGRETIY
jgi:hypothetical protein